MGMSDGDKIKCMGGYGFLCTALGIFLFVPGTILFALFYSDASQFAIQVTAGVLFACSLFFLVLGIGLCTAWCRRAEYWKKPQPDAEAEDALHMTPNNTNNKNALPSNTNGDPYRAPGTPLVHMPGIREGWPGEDSLDGRSTDA